MVSTVTMSCATIFLVTLLLSLVSSKLVDLSHKHGPNTLTSLPGQPNYNLTHLIKGVGVLGLYVEGNYFGTNEHSGTHIDAPSHFQEGGISVDNIPLEHTVLEGVVVDASQEASRDREHVVTLEALKKWESTHGRIPQEAAVLFYFGWYQKFDNEVAYRGTSDVRNTLAYSYPYVSLEAVRWLLDNRSVRLVGSDTITVDPFQLKGQSSMFPIHQLLLPNNRLIIENLRDLDKLPPRGFRFYATPVKYEGASGTQVRAFAMTYDSLGSGAGLVSVSLTLTLSFQLLVLFV